MKWWENPRLLVSIVMWLVLGAISVMSIIFAEPLGADAMWGVLGPLILGVGGLFIIWVLPELVLGHSPFESSTRQPERRADYGEKPKRMSKMDMLMEMMDEDERRAFKETLKRQMLNNLSDGELNYDAESLESLMDEEKRLRR